MLSETTTVVHGGTDALGVPAHDFSTNRNACGPCPAAVQALQAAHSAQYPDPHYTDVCAQLAAFHGVAPERIVIGGSSSELIHRLTQHAVRSGARARLVMVPACALCIALWKSCRCSSGGTWWTST